MLTVNVERLPTYQMERQQRWTEGKAEGMVEGLVKDAHERSLGIARKLLKQGLDPDWVASVTKLPLEVVDQLRWEKSG